jgi:oligopeptide transport system substrate-binding protein
MAADMIGRASAVFQRSLAAPPLAHLVLAAALGLAACAGPEQPETAIGPAVTVGGPSGTELADRQILRRGNGTEPETLDPHRVTGVSAANILRDLYEGLVTEAPDGSLVPGAAESWTVSEDGLVYTFRLRPEGRWSNGDPVTAADFVNGLRRSADPATLSEYSAILNPLENAVAVIAGELPPEQLGVRALDPLTLEIRLAAPTPYLLGLLAHSSTYPIHGPSLAAHRERFARPGRLVSNGAYRLAEWQVQSHVKLERNPHYRENDRTIIDEVWYYPVENQDAELNRYRAGELDMTYGLPTRQMDWIRRNLAGELRIEPYLGSYVFGYNLTRAPFRDNRELRLALSMALDRDILTGRIAGAGEIPAYSWVPPIPGYDSPVPEWAGWTQEARNAEARRLYQAAGYSPERPLKVRLLYNTDNNHRRLTAAMAAMWREVLGVQTELVNQEWQVFLQTRREKYETEIFRYGWIGDYQDPYTFAEILRSGFGLNDMGYSNPRYDELLNLASREGNPDRRLALLREAEALMLEDQPIIPIYFYVSKKVVKPWVAGYQGNIMDHHHSRHFRILRH